MILPTSDPIILSLISVVVVSLISFIGVLTFSVNEKTLKKILLYFVGFSAGALFGDTFLHLLPEVMKESGFSVQISAYILSGILTFFIIEKVVHWRHCHIPTSKHHPHPFVYMNLFGDAIHNFIDGLIIAASYFVSIPVGIATTVAVIFHELPQELGDFGVLIHGGFSKNKALALNFLTAIVAVLGALVTFLLSSYIESFITFIASFAAGSFIYIAGTDLIPELHKKFSTKGAVIEAFAIFLGIAIMYVLLFVG